MGVDSNAYWYKANKLISLKDGIHINDLTSNPSVFGFTEKEINDCFKKYNEKKGTEGKAREELMSKAMDNGWLRVRKIVTRQGSVWTIQFDNFNKRKKDIKNLISKLLLDMEIMKQYDDVHLLSYSGDYNKTYSSFNGNPVMSLLESLKAEEKIVVEKVNEYKYFNY